MKNKIKKCVFIFFQCQQNKKATKVSYKKFLKYKKGRKKRLVHDFFQIFLNYWKKKFEFFFW